MARQLALKKQQRSLITDQTFHAKLHVTTRPACSMIECRRQGHPLYEAQRLVLINTHCYIYHMWFAYYIAPLPFWGSLPSSMQLRHSQPNRAGHSQTRNPLLADSHLIGRTFGFPNISSEPDRRSWSTWSKDNARDLKMQERCM